MTDYSLSLLLKYTMFFAELGENIKTLSNDYVFLDSSENDLSISRTYNITTDTTKDVFDAIYLMSESMLFEIETKRLSDKLIYRGFKAGLKGSVAFGVMVFPYFYRGALIPISFDAVASVDKITLTKYYS